MSRKEEKETKARFSNRIFGDDPFAPGDTRDPAVHQSQGR